MNLIDYTYFQKRLLALPNLQGVVLEQLNDYIPVLQEKYLDVILGVKLKKQFLEGLEEPVILDKWLRLRDGYVYDVSDISYEWKGFVRADKISPIANYVFCNLITNNQFRNEGIGETRSKSENSVIITPQYRVSQVWNDMVEMNKTLYHFLNEFESVDYPDWHPDYEKIKSFLNYDYNIGL